ncbi:helix-turn-helix domain-containing protein [Saccharibacillus alkalitolerans]|uniref:Helix-turn-helix transcriptional regulator n=1 Tax=Saccharibacillus alkalitolerans TaxID=2705290 RepID=A0ABX0F2M1_9BACL|nr:AraC family transcriptional regulator [Saccharibacillus alkalitolerans]NGZ73908.1 helix-turn-helix transcriptional regulator [Saccharibacillus alkalitolerans]
MLRLIKCGFNTTHPEGILIDRPDGSGCYVFVLFKSKTQVEAAGGSFTVYPDTWMIFGPRTPYRYRNLEAAFVNDWLHFGGDEAAALIEELDLPLDVPVPAVHSASLSRLVMELHRTASLGGPLQDRILDADLTGFLMKLGNLRRLRPRSEPMARYFPQLSEIRNQLYSTPQQRYTIDELAAEVNLSRSHFQHLYKELFGCPVSLDMIRSRLEFAKYLLENGSHPVGIVSRMCGYENETHFMRQFKKFAGKTPSQYRNGCLEEAAHAAAGKADS